MTLTLNQSTSIRPLGEEHLRMFKRTVGSAEDVEKVVIPKGAKARANVILTQEVGKASDAAKIMQTYKGRLATLPEFLVAKRTMPQMSYPVFLDWKNAPAREGWYSTIDITNHNFRPIDRDDADKLGWRQRVFVYSGAGIAIREKRLLYLSAVYGRCLDLSGNFRPEALGQFALVVPRPPSLPLSRKI